MSGEVWYRKWRPQRFEEVAGQEHVTTTLRNAVSGRGGRRVGHAYLFTGPRGTGKTTTARILAKAVNCADPRDGEPCGACAHCQAVHEGRALDVIEIDAASNNRIDDIRALRERVQHGPVAGEHKVYLIDEVHELTRQAFDGFLKTLEEPPSYVIFVLATTEVQKVPGTIMSRCQRFDFHRVPIERLVARLRVIAEAEGLAVDDPSLALIGRKATGSLRDAINLLEQLVTMYGDVLGEAQVRQGLGYSDDPRAGDLVRALLARDIGRSLRVVGEAADEGLDLRVFQRAAVERLRLALQWVAGINDTGALPQGEVEPLRAAAAGADLAHCARVLEAVANADLREDPTSSLALELAVVEALAPRPGGAPQAAAPRGAVPAGPRPDAAGAPRAAPAPRPAPARPASPAPVSARQPTSAVPPARRPEPAAARVPATASRNGPTAPRIVPADVPLTLELAREHFRDLYELLRARNSLAAALLNSAADVIEIGDDLVTFGFRYSSHAERAQASEAVFGEALTRLFSRPLRARCVHEPDVRDRMKETQPGRGHLVEEALRQGLTPVEE